jgi:UDP-N-acetylmuramoyl-tripeptide--D-alanyl-D-alanine ligase
MTEPLWSRDAFLAGTGGRPRSAATGDSADVAGISIDSRTIRPGEAYFAIRGDVHDGHVFAASALEKGAALAVVAQDKLAELPPDGRYVVVDDVLMALRRLGMAARARTKARIVAVTGSVGKTSTKEALRHVLAAQGRVHASVASFNNHWGVPLTLARMPAETQYGIFEIGMNHAGEIADLVPLVRPHVAVVTTIAPAHLEVFGTTAKIAEAKAEIFLGLTPDGTAIVNGDIPEAPILIEAAERAGATIVTFGEAANLSTRLTALKLKPEGSDAVASVLGRSFAFRLGAPGKHLAVNALAVLSAVAALGADVGKAAQALAEVAPPKGRGVLVSLTLPDGKATLVDDSYNGNPASMRAAMALTAQVAGEGRKLAALGDMLELGEAAPLLHAELAGPLAEAGIDTVFLAGPLMENLWHALPAARRGGYARTAAALEPLLAEALRPGDTLMIKGSNSSLMHRLAAALTARFN